MGGGGEHQSCKNYSVGVLALPAQVSTGKDRRGSLPPWDLAVRGGRLSLCETKLERHVGRKLDF